MSFQATPVRLALSATYALSALLFLCDCSPQNAPKLKAFAADFRQANAAETVEPMLALYALEGSTQQTVNLLKNALRNELGLPIRSIDFAPLSGAPEENIDFSYQGVRYVPTIEPTLRMRVRYTTEDALESRFSIGQNATGEWRIVSTRPLAP